MKQRSFPSLAATMMIAIIALIASAPDRASDQQNPSCCDFIVNTSNIPNSCFPITIQTLWSNGQPYTVSIAAPGFQTFHLPFNCPPAPTFVSATVASNCCLGPVSYYCGGCLFIELRFTC
jgi:hypothetical protein